MVVFFVSNVNLDLSKCKLMVCDSYLYGSPRTVPALLNRPQRLYWE